jgi:hypothetical protein
VLAGDDLEYLDHLAGLACHAAGGLQQGLEVGPTVGLLVGDQRLEAALQVGRGLLQLLLGARLVLGGGLGRTGELLGDLRALLGREDQFTPRCRVGLLLRGVLDRTAELGGK